jgi:hypothetical protein
MPHRALRIAAALTTFLAGLALVWFSNQLVPLETRLADWLVPTSEFTLRPVSFVSREETETQKVYETVIRELFTDNDTEMIVTLSETNGCPESHINEEDAMRAEWETLLDYTTKNSELGKSFPLLELARPQVLLDRGEVKKIFERRDGYGWRIFYKRFPHSSGFLDFSRVGFNREGDQAFVYASRSCGGLCGEGWYVLLKKGSRGWLIEHKRMAWVS